MKPGATFLKAGWVSFKNPLALIRACWAGGHVAFALESVTHIEWSSRAAESLRSTAIEKRRTVLKSLMFVLVSSSVSLSSQGFLEAMTFVSGRVKSTYECISSS